MTAPPTGRQEERSWRMLVALGGAGALAGLLIVLAYRATLPAIEAYRAEVLRQAIYEVLQEPFGYDTLYAHAGVLTRQPPAGVDPRALERVYLGYREDGRRIGFALVAAEPGFQDLITVIFGYDAEARTVIGMKVLDNRETPGLGDKIAKDPGFVDQFEGAQVSLVGVKPGTAAAPNEVDLITGATISSRAVVNIINHAVERWVPLLQAYGETPSVREGERGGGRGTR